jgi:hypothetical protein
MYNISDLLVWARWMWFFWWLLERIIYMCA